MLIATKILAVQYPVNLAQETLRAVPDDRLDAEKPKTSLSNNASTRLPDFMGGYGPRIRSCGLQWLEDEESEQRVRVRDH